MFRQKGGKEPTGKYREELTRYLTQQLKHKEYGIKETKVMDNKKVIINILVLLAFLNIFVLSISLFFIIGYTGDPVLGGQIIPGETFEGEFILNNTKDLSLIFETTHSTSNIEWLNIIITYPNGAISSWEKGFSTSRSESGGQTTTTDATMILKPQLTGKYYIKITNAEFPTNLHIKSGMINPTKNGLLFFGCGIFWFIVLFAMASISLLS